MMCEYFRMDAFIRVITQALDMVEIDLAGASTNHGKRIAVLCAAMGRQLGFSEERVSCLASSAMLHDCALTEYIMSERAMKTNTADYRIHCEIGQRNVDTLPFGNKVQDFIRYHHERADGQGPFGLSEGNYPLEAELIAAADMLDVQNHLQRIVPEGLFSLRKAITAATHHSFTGRAAELLLNVLDDDLLVSLRDDCIAETSRQVIPLWQIDLCDPALVSIAAFVARIIDYKSAFTMRHTTQIANRSWVMAEYYGYDTPQKIQFYLAAAMHDLGKLAIPSEVLEKPGKLTREEFDVIKSHVTMTRNLLNDADGMGPIVEWAANHHEKLDGSGYPFGKTAADLDHNSRLMTCIDIYQAVSEERPYHPRRSHEETMPVLYKMAESGGVDPGIVKDMDIVMARYSGIDLAGPSVW